jgi:hypothetical protein
VKLALPALLLTLAAAPASAFTPERAGMMVDAIRANGCAMSGAEAPEALGPIGLEPVEVQAFVDTLYAAGLVSLSDDMQTLNLTPLLCEAEGDAAMAMIVQAFEAQEAQIERWLPEFSPERGAELIAALRDTDCMLTDERAQEVLPPLGFTPVEVRDIVAVMVDGELASVSDDGAELRLSESVCAGDPAADAAALATLIATWEERHPLPEMPSEEGPSE